MLDQDGSANSIINKKLQTLHEVAHALNLPDADKINSTGLLLYHHAHYDSAATKKRLTNTYKRKMRNSLVLLVSLSECF